MTKDYDNIKMFIDALRTAFESNIRAYWTFDIVFKNDQKWSFSVGSGHQYSILYIPDTPMQNTWLDQVEFYMQDMTDVSDVFIKAILNNPYKEKEFSDITTNIMAFFEGIKEDQDFNLDIKIRKNNIRPTNSF